MTGMWAARAGGGLIAAEGATNGTKLAAGLCSFSAETQVLMADGTTKEMQDLRVGDVVAAADPETGKSGAESITNLWIHDDEMRLLTVDGESVATTSGHPFWNASEHVWQPAGELEAGDALLTKVGGLVFVRSLSAGIGNQAAYNLRVTGLHTYYVLVGNTPVLVHNSCGKTMSSAIGSDGFLAKAAQQAGRNQRVQQEMDGLFKQLSEGNMNPGLGSKSLAGTDVAYARGRNGARLFFRNVDGGVQVVGKADKANEAAVIRRLTEIYGQ
ncbi:Hint domain-containing protein [Micromonospora tulbaghiae]